MTRGIALLGLISIGAAGSAQTFNPIHKYSVGDADQYTIKVDAKSSGGPLTIASQMSKIVTKTYDDGDADIETTVSNLAITLDGSPIPFPTTQKPSPTKYDKYGMPISAAGKSLGLSFLRFGTFYGDKELNLGDTYKLEQVDAKDPKNQYTGTVKLVALADGKATLAISIDGVAEGSGPGLHLEGTAIVSADSDRLISFKGTAKNVPATPGLVISSADFSMVKK